MKHIVPTEMIRLLESELYGMEHGRAWLEVLIRDGKPRFEVSRTRSFYDDTASDGVDIDRPKKPGSKGAR